MIAKLIAVAALVAVVQASYLPYTLLPSAPVLVKYAAPAYTQDYNTDHKYEFGYAVNDPYTGDRKSQHEVRDGNSVRGYYSLDDADGTLRTVHYTADEHNGFNAVVEKSGHTIHPTPAIVKVQPYVAPLIHTPLRILPYAAPYTGYYP